ncbi:MAG: hypothetical protein RLY31_2234 [Bacteroidota bacterium]|jgi:uncharacterized protein YndB with AHSA1/START domain
MEPISVSTLVNAPLSTVWACWTQPEHITNWYFAHPDWHCPAATNDLRTGGRFSFALAAKDGSFSFDFQGVYDAVKNNAFMAFTLDDGRKATVSFQPSEQGVRLTETFDPEQENPVHLQEAGWQAILDNFRAYTEKIPS